MISLNLKFTFIRLKNKQVFLRPGHFFEKQMRQAGFYLLFPQKEMRPYFFISSKTNEAPFFVHFNSKENTWNRISRKHSDNNVRGEIERDRIRRHHFIDAR